MFRGWAGFTQVAVDPFPLWSVTRYTSTAVTLLVSASALVQVPLPFTSMKMYWLYAGAPIARAATTPSRSKECFMRLSFPKLGRLGTGRFVSVRVAAQPRQPAPHSHR